MSTSILRPDALKWRQQLVSFLEKFHGHPTDIEDLDAIQDWQRRITGGVLIQFFEFLENSVDEELYPQIADHPLHERLFVFVSDRGGMLAAEELMDTDSEQAICLSKEAWRAFLENPSTDPDEAFVHHYEFWSVWHQKIPDGWDLEELDPGDNYWLHEEGFALADGAGRGAQHLWRWDGQKMHLVDEMMTSWSS